MPGVTAVRKRTQSPGPLRSPMTLDPAPSPGLSASKRAGSALGAVLGRRGCADPDAAGRTLLLALIRLHSLGALSFDRGGAVHGADAVAEPSTDGKPLGPGVARGEGLPGSDRVALDGVGTVVRVGALGTAPAYNVGQSVCIPEEAA
jgi:hypothetical protein